jgi:glutathione synthase/RimK-type ligase-like ATP-grasp enzyme
MNLIVWPYKLGSRSARALAEALDVRRVRTTRSRYRPRANHLIVNWGNNDAPEWERFNQFRGAGQGLRFDYENGMLNTPMAVRQASDKVACLQRLSDAGVNVPQFSTSISEVREWFDEGIDIVYCRTLTRANSGRGIVLAANPDELVSAPLYTANVGRRREYRVHVVRGEVIDFAQKKKMAQETLDARGIEHNTHIRSHQNGYVFAREDVSLPTEVREQALLAIENLGLDFGAVDVAKVSGGGPAVVFEVNTAPGLEGTTLERYVDAFQRLASES